MNAVKDIFSRMADTIVQASNLNVEVGELRASVERLTQDVDRMVQRNRALDDALVTAQNERNQAREELKQTRDSLTNALSDRDRVSDILLMRDERIQRLEGELNQAKRDRDDAAFRNLEIEEKLKEVNERIGKIADVFSGLMPPKEQPKPVNHPSASGETFPIFPEGGGGADQPAEPKRDTWPF